MMAKMTPTHEPLSDEELSNIDTSQRNVIAALEGDPDGYHQALFDCARTICRLLAEVRAGRALLEGWEMFGCQITGCTNYVGATLLDQTKAELDTHIKVKAEMLNAAAKKDPDAMNNITSPTPALADAVRRVNTKPADSPAALTCLDELERRCGPRKAGRDVD
jgi:hypothetical protein